MSGSELIKALFQTAVNCDLKIYSDDFCCQLLAWVSVFGGGREETVINPLLHETIMYAKKRLNIEGGEAPNGELLPLLQAYIKEAEDYVKDKAEKPEWVTQIEGKYGLKHYK
jgi:hypothetical protein